jgi:hypothetical protein
MLDGLSEFMNPPVTIHWNAHPAQCGLVGNKDYTSLMVDRVGHTVDLLCRYPEETFIFLDADIKIYKPFRQELESLMVGYDYRYQNISHPGGEPFHCGGIQVVKSTERSRNFYGDVYAAATDFIGDPHNAPADRVLDLEKLFRAALDAHASKLGFKAGPLPHRYGSIMTRGETIMYHAINAGSTLTEKTWALNVAHLPSEQGFAELPIASHLDILPSTPYYATILGWALVDTATKVYFFTDGSGDNAIIEYTESDLAPWQVEQSAKFGFFAIPPNAMHADAHHLPLADAMPMIEESREAQAHNGDYYLMWDIYPCHDPRLELPPATRLNKGKDYQAVFISCLTTGATQTWLKQQDH